MAAFAVAGSLQVRGKQLSTDRPCLILLSGDTLYVSDPTHTGGVANIIFGTGRYATKLPEDGTTVVISLSAALSQVVPCNTNRIHDA